MLKAKNLPVFILIGLICFAGCVRVVEKESLLESLRNDIYYLASDSLEGREAGTIGAQKAATYIAERFEDLGLKPMGEEGYFQYFEFSSAWNPHSMPDEQDTTAMTGRNVLGFIDNPSDTLVILGAHFDHLGFGTQSALGDRGVVHNGADDNASGVAMILALAEMINHQDLEYDYLFVAFSGEEKGLYGSGYFVKNPPVDLEKVNYMINFDMVGRLDEKNSLAINGTGTSPSWDKVIDNIEMDSLHLITKESGVGPSDHTSFYMKDIPVLHFFTGTHEDYHKPSDDADKINYEGMYVIANFVDSLILDLDDDPVLSFSSTREESRDVSQFEVTMGVVPDYMFDGKGMRIDGVREGRPADNAGIEDGDIVIQLGDHEVSDMRSYMEALSQFKEGDETTVTVKRGDRELTFPIQF